jgi:hypothetical protein
MAMYDPYTKIKMNNYNKKKIIIQTCVSIRPVNNSAPIVIITEPIKKRATANIIALTGTVSGFS